MALVFYYKDMLEKVTMQRDQRSVSERTQLNAAHVQLLKTLRRNLMSTRKGQMMKEI